MTRHDGPVLDEHPHVDALVARLVAEAARLARKADGEGVASATAADLRALLTAWAAHDPEPGFRCGPLTLARRPRELDRIPCGWKHDDYGCADMSVCETFPALVLGTIRRRGDDRPVFVRVASAPAAVLLVPWWDERGPAETGVVIAPSVEALLADGPRGG